MASPAVQNPVPASGESKSARKKKAKAEATANGAEQPLAVPATTEKEESGHGGDGEESREHPYIANLAKQIRNLNKKLSALSKSDAIVAENKGASLDELVAQKKLNSDQRAALQKKPQIQQQLASLEDQITQYRQFDADSQARLSKQKAELEDKHGKESAELREQLQASGVEASAKQLKEKLLIFSQFLRCAAAKRQEEERESAEAKAFEGALLLVYGGDDTAVETALKLIEGTDELVPGIEEEDLGIKCESFRMRMTTIGCMKLTSTRLPDQAGLHRARSLSDRGVLGRLCRRCQRWLGRQRRRRYCPCWIRPHCHSRWLERAQQWRQQCSRSGHGHSS